MNGIDISIIIVNCNGKHFLRNCISSLSWLSYPSFEVILVDNGSTDGSLSYIRSLQKKYRWLLLVKNDENVGFASGNNIGYQKSRGEYIVFLNNDTIVTPDFLQPLVSTLKSHQKIAGVQSKILRMDDHSRLDSVGAFFTSTGFLYHYGYHQKDTSTYKKETPLYTAKGACMCFKRAVIDEVGLFDPDYFAYFEETDFCHRVWLAGYEIWYQPKSVIYHKIGGTFRSQNSATMNFHSYKNRICSYSKNLGAAEFIKLVPLHIILCIFVAILYILRGNNPHAKAILQALIWNVQHLSATRLKRAHVQNTLRKVPDESFMTKIKKNPDMSYYYYLFSKELIGYSEKPLV